MAIDFLNAYKLNANSISIGSGLQNANTFRSAFGVQTQTNLIRAIIYWSVSLEKSWTMSNGKWVHSFRWKPFSPYHYSFFHSDVCSQSMFLSLVTQIQFYFPMRFSCQSNAFPICLNLKKSNLNSNFYDLRIYEFSTLFSLKTQIIFN